MHEWYAFLGLGTGFLARKARTAYQARRTNEPKPRGRPRA